MLVLGSRFHNTPIMSLQTGAELARTKRALIDPRDLTISAFELEGQLLTEHPSFLRVNDIREVSAVGMIIDDSDEIVGLDDVIKLKKLHDLNFELIGMPVVDQHRRKLGKVQDYTTESHGFVIQQIQVKRGMLRSITDTGLLIHRSQIVEINDHQIIVKSTGKKQVVEPVQQATEKLEYSNPFRQPAPQVEPIKIDVRSDSD